MIEDEGAEALARKTIEHIMLAKGRTQANARYAASARAGAQHLARTLWGTYRQLEEQDHTIRRLETELATSRLLAWAETLRANDLEARCLELTQQAERLTHER